MRESNWDFYWGEQKELEHWQKPSESVIEFIKSCNCDKQPKVLDLGQAFDYRHLNQSIYQVQTG